MSNAVELRAFRGTRRSSTYRSHTVGRDAAERLAAVGDLTPLAAAIAGDETVLDQDGSRGLADEATRLRSTALVPDLDDELTAIAEIANWCARATRGAWLQVRPAE